MRSRERLEAGYSMALYTTLHLHNVPAGREADYASWFDGPAS